MGRDRAAKPKVLLNEAWDEEGRQGVNCSNADRAAKTSSCLCARVKRSHLCRAGEQTLGRRTGFLPQCVDICCSLALLSRWCRVCKRR